MCNTVFKYFVVISMVSILRNAILVESSAKSGFFVYLPSSIYAEKNETACVSLYNVDRPVRIHIELKWKDKNISVSKFMENGHTCFSVHIQRQDIKEPQHVDVKVTLFTNNTVYSSHNQNSVLIYPKKQNQVFITTDKKLYKPKDTVKFRIFLLDANLMPVSTQISEITIKNPLDVIVAVWENVTVNRGVTSLEYNLVPESLTGKWKIAAGKSLESFKVFKYTLPRFKCYINFPTEIYYKSSQIAIEVCAKYSFGNPLVGCAEIQLTTSLDNKLDPVIKKGNLEKGCATFNVLNNELFLSNKHNSEESIFISAKVNENETNQIEVASGKISIKYKPYVLEFVSERDFIPGLPYDGKLILKNILSNATGETIQICYTLAIKQSWNYFNEEFCKNFSFAGFPITFKLWPLKNNIENIDLKATSLDHSDLEVSMVLNKLHGTANQIRLIRMVPKENICHQTQHFVLQYICDKFANAKNLIFYYLITTNSEIHKQKIIPHRVNRSIIHTEESDEYIGKMHKFVRQTICLDRFDVKFKLTKQMVSTYDILVYYISDEMKVVSDIHQQVIIEPCSPKAFAYWSPNKIGPGETATLILKTEADALCTVASVDKSVSFLSGNNHNFGIADIIGDSIDDPIKNSVRNKCSSSFNRGEDILYTTNKGKWESKRNHVSAFTDIGVTVITNVKSEAETCSGPQFLQEQYKAESEDVNIPLRSFFPETWLWEEIPVSNNFSLQRIAPHSITSWSTNVICMSEFSGITFVPEIEVSTIQHFFLNVLLPFSVQRGETFYVTVHIFNYLEYDFPVKVLITLSSQLEQTDSDGLIPSYCLKANNTMVHKFKIYAREVGNGNITILAQSDNQYPLECGPETVVYKKDSVLKTITIDAEGYPVTASKSVLLCATNNNNTSGPFNSNFKQSSFSWNISIPSNIVPDTEAAYIAFNGDLLSLTLDNLEKLLNIPNGCGEQIMALMAPNLFVLQYSNFTGLLTKSLKKRIIRNLKIGYQKILNYVHEDGSFSAFGYYDNGGSIFLTAFVLRILEEAKSYMYVNNNVLRKASKWIFENQLENGCFNNNMHHVFQDLGSASANNTVALTSYVMISLLESKAKIPSNVENSAKYCIRKQYHPDKYSLAISCYALFKFGLLHEGNQLLQELMDSAYQQEGDMLWWSMTGEYTIHTSDIEITGYVLLALLEYPSKENLARAHAVARWITSNISPTGAFYSTQDTVVALNALAKYSKIIYTQNLSMDVVVEANSNNSTFHIKSNDKLKIKKIVLKPVNETTVKVSANGNGCILAQGVHSYNLISTVKEYTKFSLSINSAPLDLSDNHSARRLSLCFKYIGSGEVNMAVVEVGLPSGYKVERSSLYKLVNASTSGVKLFEEHDGQINLYFTNVNRQEFCCSLTIKEEFQVEIRKSSIIKLYDYYKPENKLVEWYDI